ncbi:MAG: hypothetical protein LBF50_09290, partial [Azoarcus sp.]|nr:hypothetical protein [Azoarcus sp.]
MNTAERFIAGEDRLSAVLRAAPLFDAPAHMAAWMHRAAHAIEDERRAGREADGGVCVFEPPARLHDAVLQEAQALERAQEPRRQALRAALAREASVEEVLGAPVAAETEAWLRETWARQTPRNAARPPSTSRRVWWKPGLAFGASFTVALLAGLAAHHYWPAPPIPGLFADSTDHVHTESESPSSAPVAMADDAPLPPAVAEANRRISAAPPTRIRAAPGAPQTGANPARLRQSEEGLLTPRHRELAKSPRVSPPAPTPESALPALAPSSATAAKAKPHSPAKPAVATAYLWPVDSEQWQQLAGTLARNEPAPA